MFGKWNWRKKENIDILVFRERTITHLQIRNRNYSNDNSLSKSSYFCFKRIHPELIEIKTYKQLTFLEKSSSFSSDEHTKLLIYKEKTF